MWAVSLQLYSMSFAEELEQETVNVYVFLNILQKGDRLIMKSTALDVTEIVALILTALSFLGWLIR